jgi:hypothetical protein
MGSLQTDAPVRPRTGAGDGSEALGTHERVDEVDGERRGDDAAQEKVGHGAPQAVAAQRA